MVMVGVVESTSADQLSVQVASMKNSLSKVNQQMELAYNMLRLQLGLGAEAPLSLTEKLTNLVDEEAIAYLMLEPFNIHQNINIQLINKNLDLSKKQVAMAKTNFLPTVAGFYSYTHKLTTTSFDMTPNNMIGINASMPLFTSFSNCSKVKQAKKRYRSASIDKENLLDQLSIQEKQLRFNLKSANESYKIQKKNIEVSNRVFKNISTKYEQGAASALDIVNAHNNLLTAQCNYISSVMELLNAQSALNNLLGKK
jgi:outer membrane protein TolC